MFPKSVSDIFIGNANQIKGAERAPDSLENYRWLGAFLVETFFHGWRDVSDRWDLHVQRMMPDIEVPKLLKDVNELLAKRHDESRLDQIVHAEADSDFNVYRDAGTPQIAFWLRNLIDLLIRHPSET